MIAAHAHTQSLGWLGWLTTGLFLAAISLAVLGIVRVTQRLLGRGNDNDTDNDNGGKP